MSHVPPMSHAPRTSMLHVPTPSNAAQVVPATTTSSRTMNILLVSPRTPDTFWSFSHVMRLVGRKTAFPPLGLMTVAAMLPRNWNLRLVDLNVTALRDDDLRWADAVFLSAMIVQEPSAREVIARANALARPVVAGGPLFTTGAERFSEVACCVVLREGMSLGEQELRSFLAARLADFKVPRKVLLLEAIPKGATGKVQRIGMAQRLGLA